MDEHVQALDSRFAAITSPIKRKRDIDDATCRPEAVGVGSYVMAIVDRGKLPWPSRIEDVVPTQDPSADVLYRVYCPSDNAVLPAKKILPFTEIDSWTNMAERTLKRKPQTLRLWKNDVEWAEKAKASYFLHVSSSVTDTDNVVNLPVTTSSVTDTGDHQVAKPCNIPMAVLQDTDNTADTIVNLPVTTSSVTDMGDRQVAKPCNIPMAVLQETDNTADTIVNLPVTTSSVTDTCTGDHQVAKPCNIPMVVLQETDNTADTIVNLPVTTSSVTDMGDHQVAKPCNIPMAVLQDTDNTADAFVNFPATSSSVANFGFGFGDTILHMSFSSDDGDEIEDDMDSDYQPDSDMDSNDNMEIGAVNDSDVDLENDQVENDAIKDNDMDADHEDDEVENDDDMMAEGVEDEFGKCSHESLSEEFITRDKVHQGIYVRKTLKSSISQTGRKKATDRVYNNYHCCFVCQKLSTNILKHLRCHKDHEDCKELLRLKKEIEKGNSKDEEIVAKKDQLKAKQTLLRNKGDNLHNMTVIEMKKGELIVARKQGKFSSDEYGPCPLCLEWIKKESLSSKHRKTCPGSVGAKKMTKGEAILRSEFAMGKINETASKGLLKEVYPMMTRDNLTVSAKADPLIVALGNCWLRRNLGNKLKRKYYTSSRMRGSARLLQHLQDLSKEKLALAEYLKPKYFDLVCQCALLCASMENDDEEDLKSPSAALKIGFDIGRMANIKLGLALRSGSKEQKLEAEEFSSLLKLEWTTRVSKLAHLKLQERKVNKQASPLPIPEDLSVLAGRVMNEMKTMKYEKDFDTYRRAVTLVQTRLLTYNKRRSGELEALSLQNYRGRSIGLDEADSALLGNDMTELERHLVESQELIKIRGKNGKTVPVLVPEDTKEALAFIAEDNVRRAVGIKAWNPYLFANTGDSVMRAYDSLKTICAELSLMAPERITSVSMRKYIATLSQVIDMKDHELEWLCTHLGHTASIHKLHYRATSGFIERVNMGKLMLLQDLNLAGKYAGQRLQDIDITDVVNARPERATVTLQQDQENASGCANFNIDDDDEEVVPKKKKNVQRQSWTTEEEKEIEELFRENFESGKNPGLKDCTNAMAKSRKKKGLVHKRSWETIKKKVIRMMKKKDH